MSRSEFIRDIRNSNLVHLTGSKSELKLKYLSYENWLYVKVSSHDIEELGIDKKFSKIDFEIPVLKSGVPTRLNGKALMIFVSKNQWEWTEVANEFCQRFSHFNFLSLLRSGGILRICPIHSTVTYSFDDMNLLDLNNFDHAVTT